jgi:hypothetical protein
MKIYLESGKIAKVVGGGGGGGGGGGAGVTPFSYA